MISCYLSHSLWLYVRLGDRETSRGSDERTLKLESYYFAIIGGAVDLPVSMYKTAIHGDIGAMNC